MSEENSSKIMSSGKLPFSEDLRHDYSLSELPRDDSGKVLYRGDSEREYLAYAEWLAAYLYNVLTPPAPEIQEIINENFDSKSPDWAIRFLAMEAAVYDMQMDSVGNWIDSEEEALEMGFYTSEQLETGRVTEANRQANNVSPEDVENFCDLPWRVPLAWILKKVPDKKERVKLIRSFFAEYQEYSRK